MAIPSLPSFRPYILFLHVLNTLLLFSLESTIPYWKLYWISVDSHTGGRHGAELSHAISTWFTLVITSRKLHYHHQDADADTPRDLIQTSGDLLVLVCVCVCAGVRDTFITRRFTSPPQSGHRAAPSAQGGLVLPFATIFSTPPHLSPNPWQPFICPPLPRFSHLEKRCVNRRNHTVCNLLWLAFFTQH